MAGYESHSKQMGSMGKSHQGGQARARDEHGRFVSSEKGMRGASKATGRNTSFGESAGRGQASAERGYSARSEAARTEWP